MKPNLLLLDLKSICNKTKLPVFVFFLVFSFLGQKSFAQTNTWDGSSSANWNTGANWSLNHVPLATEDVVIPDGITTTINVNTAAVCKSLTMSAGSSNNGISIAINQSLTVTNGVVINAPTGGGTRSKSIAVGTATLSCASISMTNSASDTRDASVSVSTGTINVTGDITMDGTSLRNNITFTGAGVLNLGGNFTGTNGGILVPSTGTVNLNGGTSQLIQGTNTVSFYNLTISKNASTDIVTSSSIAFTVGHDLTVTQGNLKLQATNANYTVSNDLNVGVNGTITHSVDWGITGKLLSVGGSIGIDGLFTYTVRSHVQMTSAGTETVRTGSNTSSAFSILTLTNGTFNANGTLRVNDNFWAMFNTAGNFHTNGQTVYANAALLCSGGTFYIDGGTLNVTGGMQVGSGTAGTVNFSSGTLNTDALTLGSGAITGAFNHTGGTANISGNLTISNTGTYTCTGSPSINISGDWTNNKTAAGFVPASSTVTFNSSSAAQNINGSSTSQTFNNIIINKAGQQLNVAGSTTTLTLNGSMTLTAGTFAAGTATAINVAGNWTNNGTAFTAGSATVTFNGSSGQTVNGSVITTFNNVTLNNSNGLLLSGVDLNISGGSGALNFLAGKITSGSNKVSLGSAASISGAGAGKYVYGNLQMGVATGSPTKVFEIGDASNYTPLTVLFNSVTVAGNVTAYTAGTEHANILTSTIDETKSVNRYWIMTNSGVSLINYTATFNWVAGDVDAGAATANFIIGRYISSWVYATMGTRNATNCTATLSSFGSYACGEGGASVPSITTQPADQTICSGSSISYTAIANDKPASAVTWQISTDNGVSFSNLAIASPYSVSTSTVSNVTTSTLTINPVASSMDGYSYRAVFTNSRGTATSFDGLLTVLAAPTANAGSALSTICGSSSSAPLGGSVGGSATGGTWSTPAGGTFTPNATTLNATWTPPGGFTGTATLTLTTSGGSCGTATASKTQVVSANAGAVSITPSSASICVNAIQSLVASNTETNTFSSGTVNVAIPDNTAAGATSTIAVSGVPAGATVTGISVTLNVTHTRDGDLVMNLKAPNGSILNLVNARGGAGANFTNTVINSTSATALSTGSAPFTSTFKPDAASAVGANPGNVSNTTTISSLYSTANGNWVFSARDATSSNTGTINSWSIAITYVDPITWSPVTYLYTNAGATTAYTAGQTYATVYAKPTVSGTTTYTATATNSAGCTSTQTVAVTAGPVVTVTPDYCYGGGYIQLNASSTPAATSWLWSTGATTSSILVNVAGNYTVTATTAGGCVSSVTSPIAQELVVNGDFSSGNTGFTSAYGYTAYTSGCMYPEALYTIGTSPNFTHSYFFGHDHTTGSGNMLIVNGSGSPVSVWQETITVQPNTTYYFAAWAMSLNDASPFAQLQFDINGTGIGTTAVLPAGPNSTSAPYSWTQFYGSWTSGAGVTSAVVSIKDLQTALGGNDFGIDDISFGTLATFINLSSTSGTDAQTVCVNSPITNITYTIGSGSGGPSVSGLPAGVSYSFSGTTLTISGTPTATGTYTYTVTTSSCNPVTKTGTITVNGETIGLSSAAGTDAQTACTSTGITNITYSIGGLATGATVSGLPTGVTGSYSGGVFTISGNPTSIGTYTYTVTTTGSCTHVTATGTITVVKQTIVRTSAAGTNVQTVCVNAAITNITYSVGGTATGASVSGLPAGVSGSYSSGVFTISGTPTAVGSFTYVILTSGATCTHATTGGTITVNGPTVTLTSAVGTNAQTTCVNTAITDITYNIGGTATGASVSGLPAGVSGSYSLGVYTISGTPTVTGAYTYTITTSGGSCGTTTANGTITVNQQTISLSSAAGTNAQTKCVNSAITNITYAVGGSATGASVSGLPAGVSGSYSGGVYTISGTPTATGTFNYTVTTSGSCSPAATANGTITVQAATVTLSSSAGTDAQTKCINTAITNITYSIGGTATGATVSGLPAGVSGSFSAGTYTISGIATATGTFNYTVTTTGGSCTAATANGSITVQSATITLTSSAGTDAQTKCVNTAITNITYSIGGTATGASVSGLPAGVTGSYSGAVYTISGTATASGTFNYTVTTTGGSCTAATANGSIIVSPAAVGGTIANVSVCYNDNGNLTLSGNVGTVSRWEVSTDAGSTWTNISNTTTTQSFTAVTQTTWYRALVQSGACASTAYSNTARVGIHNLWTGQTSADWNTGSNWSDGLTPTTSCPDVTIPVLSGPNVYPQLTSGTATVNNIIIYPNATMLVSSATLQVAGTITNNGTLDITNGTLELNGTAAAQTVAGSTFSTHTIQNLIISNSNGVSLANTNDTMRITGVISFNANNAVLNTNDNLTLVSNASGTASVGDLTNAGSISGANITGNVTVERYIPNHSKAWQFLSTPTSGQSINNAWQEANTTLGNTRPGYGTIITGQMSGAVSMGFDIYTPTGPSMKTYNSASNIWDGVANTSMQIANKKGYMFFVRGDRSVTTSSAPATATTLRTTGKLYTFGADAPSTTTVLAGKMESIGNPYASAIDFRLITKPAAPDVDAAFYVWDPLLTNNYYGLGGYQTISAANGWKPIPGGTANYDANVAYPYIQSGQAFLVHATGLGGTVIFGETNKVNQYSMANRNTSTDMMANRQFFRTYLYNASSMLSDGNTVAFDSAFTNAYDADDALKASNSGENLAIVRGDKLLALEARHTVVDEDTVFYTFTNIRRTNYQLRFKPESMADGLTAKLVDKYLNTVTPVSTTDTSSYNFTINYDAGSWALDRFYIIFKQSAPTVITSITANRNGAAVAVNWTTSHEYGIQEYQVERSADNQNFESIQDQQPTVNNDNTAAYAITDLQPLRTTSYYRIKGLKNTGSLIYSATVRVVPGKNTGLSTGKNTNTDKAVANNTTTPEVNIFPNPVVDKIINLQFSNQVKGVYQLELTDLGGQLVYRNAIELNSINATEKLQLEKSIASGNYQLKITSPGGVRTIKQVIIQ